MTYHRKWNNMKFNKNNTFKVYGDQSFRGKCISEDAIQIAFVAWARYNYPAIAEVLMHPKNEGKRTPQQVAMERKMGGITAGASDIIILGCPAFVLEIKRDDHTQSKWQPGQQAFLNNSDVNGCFAAVALGLSACKEAFLEWLKESSRAQSDKI